MTLLSVAGMDKSFLGVQVLHDVALDLDAGELHAVVGENGAGKSTFVKTLAGVHAPDRGEIALDGEPVVFSHPAQALAAGIAIIHQEFTLLPDRTVAENVFLGREPTRRALVDRRAMETATARLLAELEETSFGPRTPVRKLSVAQQQVVEIVKALSTDARVLIMDEPTAALADHEVGRLYALIHRLIERGLGILYISHRLREVFDLSRRITVIKDGRRVATLATADTHQNEIVRLMVGRELDDYYPPRATGVERGPLRLSVDGGSTAKLTDVSLRLYAGEVVGVAGLQGSGRTSLARALFGVDPFTGGEMTVDGRGLHPQGPREAIRAGLALVSEDRKSEGLALRQSVRDNTLLVERAVFSTPFKRRRSDAAALLESVALRAHGQEQQVRYLSGGNQQKVVIAKWLGVRPGVLIVDEPTRGVDVGAKAAIHDLIRGLAKEGMAVLLISSELPEVIGMSDRVLVMSEGRIAGELPAGPTEEQIMRLATVGRTPAETAP
ncbi:sugar ABC transporter ATP-binding protein [Streptomyces sp. NPDC054874]